MNKLKLVLVGFEYGHQPGLAKFLQQHPDITLIAVADHEHTLEPSREVARQWAVEQSVPYYEDYRRMMVELSPDLASVAVLPIHNADVVVRLAEAEIHVMCEKPIGVSAVEAESIACAVRQHGTKFTFGFPVARFATPFADALATLASGKVGEPRVAHFMYLQSKGPRHTASPEEATEAYKLSRAGGELANFGGYGVVLLRAVFAQPIESAYTEAGTFFYDSYRQIGMEDMAVTTVTYPNGALATMTIGRTTTQSIPHTDLRLEVVADAGVVSVNNGMGSRIDLYEDYRDDDPYERGGYGWIFFDPNPGVRYVHDFIAAIREDRDPLIGVDDALQFAYFLDAAYRSVQTGQPEALPALNTPETH